VAGGGQADPALGTVEQGDPGFPLQLGELLGYGRGGEMEQLGGIADPAPERHHPQDQQAAGIDIHQINLSYPLEMIKMNSKSFK
jgi:hypothetical protein